MYAHRSGLARAWLGFRGGCRAFIVPGSWGVGTVGQRSQVFHPKWRIDYSQYSVQVWNLKAGQALNGLDSMCDGPYL